MGVRCVEDDADAIDESFNGEKYSEYHEKYEGEARSVVSAPSSSSLNLSLSIGQVSCKPNSVKPKASISRRRKSIQWHLYAFTSTHLLPQPSGLAGLAATDEQ